MVEGRGIEGIWLKHPRWHDVAYWGLLAVACAVFLAMNVLTPYKEDDMSFALIDSIWTPVRSLADAFLSCRNHYMSSNGRLAEVVPLIFAGLLGKGLFNVCNTLVFGLMAHLLSLLSVRRRSVTVVALFLAVVGTCYPVPGETMLWMSGSANYLWAITASLLFVYLLQRFDGKQSGCATAVLLTAGGLIAGAFNEATSFGFFAGLCLYYAFNRRLFNRKVAMALAGYLLGVLLILVSPGAWDRAAEGGIVVNLPLGELLSSRWYIFQEKFWRFYLPAVAVLVGIGALLMRRRQAVRQCVWTYIFLCLALVMLALGIKYERAYAPWVTVSFIILAMGADWLLAHSRWLRLAVIAVSLGLAAFTFGRGIQVMKVYKAYDDQAVSEIDSAPDQAVLPARHFDGFSRFVKPMNFASTEFFAHEIIYRAYFGKRNVQFVNDSVHVRYHEGRLLDGAAMQIPQSDRPDLNCAVFTFADQDYIAVRLQTSDLPCTFQTARYYSDNNSSAPAEDSEEGVRRKHYGINIDYTPVGFFPLEYQGQCYLISASPDTTEHTLVFPLTLPPDPKEITITLK